MKIDSADFVLSATRRGQFLNDGRPEIAFVGRSNVGKSSLLNKIVGRKKLARVGSTPGRTRAVNYFLINQRFYFVDLPGYGFAKAGRKERESWARLIDDYFTGGHGSKKTKASPKQLVQLIDSKVGATTLDVEAQEYFRDLGMSPFLVATKIDKVPRSRRKRAMDAIRHRLELSEDVALVPFSAVSGEGVQQLWKGIWGFLTDSKRDPDERRSHDEIQ